MCPKRFWPLDPMLKTRLVPLHHLISQCSSPDDLKLLRNWASIEISTFCSEHKGLFEENVAMNPSKKFVNHQDKMIADLEALKKVLRKGAFKAGADEVKRKEFYAKQSVI